MTVPLLGSLLHLLLLLVLLSTNVNLYCQALTTNIVLAGGTGPMGQAVASKLDDFDVTILTRNAFLAAAPNRVTEQFGWVGARFLQKHLNVHLRDWDGGDLLDIVGQDWMGWQQDALPTADVIVHLVGGFTPQRIMACERLVRESLRCNPSALHVTVSPTEQDVGALPPTGMVKLKNERIRACEEMVTANCLHSKCLRLEAFRVDQGSDKIVDIIEDWAKNQVEEMVSS